ncbi:hypothetical protein [Aquamicrobium sp. LC103]|uniref:hypothetical protein n=1 Tax=Aquamicrobium sp. LC103 TaxID=1120658 RepID=UPI00063E7DED|nr:hypothetical protein [Aquamicrobium sp. LC103]TKT74732.1 hypothetical protein XW59_022655 [Aquamicrobium sp. LC103]
MKKNLAIAADDLPMPAELSLLLKQIEEEPGPARLLDLAMKLQAALLSRHAAAKESGGDNLGYSDTAN